MKRASLGKVLGICMQTTNVIISTVHSSANRLIAAASKHNTVDNKKPLTKRSKCPKTEPIDGAFKITIQHFPHGHQIPLAKLSVKQECGPWEAYI